MAKPPPEDAKVQALQQNGALNPHAGAVTDALFHANPFVDAHDLVQVRYEMCAVTASTACRSAPPPPPSV